MNFHAIIRFYKKLKQIRHLDINIETKIFTSFQNIYYYVYISVLINELVFYSENKVLRLKVSFIVKVTYCSLDTLIKEEASNLFFPIAIKTFPK